MVANACLATEAPLRARIQALAEALTPLSSKLELFPDDACAAISVLLDDFVVDDTIAATCASMTDETMKEVLEKFHQILRMVFVRTLPAAARVTLPWPYRD